MTGYPRRATHLSDSRSVLLWLEKIKAESSIDFTALSEQVEWPSLEIAVPRLLVPKQDSTRHNYSNSEGGVYV